MKMPHYHQSMNIRHSMSSFLGVVLLASGLLSMAPALLTTGTAATCNATVDGPNAEGGWGYDCGGYCPIEGGTQQQQADKCQIDEKTASTGTNGDGETYRFCGCDGVEPTCCHTRVMVGAAHPPVADGSCKEVGCPDPPNCLINVESNYFFTAECQISI